MIFKNSRYEYTTIDYFFTKLDNPEKPYVLYNITNMGLISYFEHAYVQGERLDQIAYKYYQNPQAYWLIMEYNPEVVDFNNIKPGTVLRIANV